MFLTPQVVSFQSLQNFLVFDSQSGKVLGRVNQIWLDKDRHQILGFTFRSSRWSKSFRSVPWEEVDSVDEIGIWVTVSEDSLLIVQPTLSIDYRLGDVVWDYAGKQLGHLVDYRFNAKTGRLLDYLWRPQKGSNLPKKLYRILPTAFKVGRIWMIHEDDIKLHSKPMESKVKASNPRPVNREALAFFAAVAFLPIFLSASVHASPTHFKSESVEKSRHWPINLTLSTFNSSRFR